MNRKQSKNFWKMGDLSDEDFDNIGSFYPDDKMEEFKDK